MEHLPYPEGEVSETVAWGKVVRASFFQNLLSLVILPASKTYFFEILRKFAIEMTTHAFIFMRIQLSKNLLKIFLKLLEFVPGFILEKLGLVVKKYFWFLIALLETDKA